MGRVDVPVELNDYKKVLQLLASGASAGLSGKLFVAPIDRVKILLQGNHVLYKDLSISASCKKIYSSSGVRGFYKGITTESMRIVPYSAIQFLVYEFSKQTLENVFGHTWYCKFIAGSCAGVAAVTVTHPLDVARTRIAYEAVGMISYQGSRDAVSTVVKEGLRASYKGYGPTLIGIIPYGGVSFCTFESLKHWSLQRFGLGAVGRPCPKNDGQLVLTVPAKFLCGAVAGCLAQTVAYPLQVVRRKMIVSACSKSKYVHNHWWDTFMYIYRKRGIRRGLLRGLSLTYVKAVPMVSVSFCVYEYSKELFGFDCHEPTS